MKVIKGFFKAVILLVVIALIASVVYLAYIFVTSGFNTSVVINEVHGMQMRIETLLQDEVSSVGGKVEDVVHGVGEKFSGD